jgi:hypothetical protein
MNSVKDSTAGRVMTTSDRVEGQPVRRGCLDAVFARVKALAAGGKSDFIYCAGRFDYLVGVTSKAIVSLFRQPGGLVRAANVNGSKSFSPAQGCGQWTSSFWIERRGALHG